MPNLRRIAKRKAFPTTIPSKETSESMLLKKDLPARITASPTKGALIPFAVRALFDHQRHKQLTLFGMNIA